MKRATLMLVALALLVGGVGEARADMMLATHAAAEALPNFGAPVSLVGNGALDTGLVTGVINPLVPFNMAQASTTPSQFFLLHAYASSELYQVTGNAAWRDVVFWNNANQPAALRLNFLVDGSLAVAGNYPDDNASVSAYTSTDPIHAFTQSDGGIFGFDLEGPTARAALGPQYASGTGQPFFESGWDSYTFDGGSFTGTFHIITPYDPNLGGYGWAVELSAEAGAAADGNATSDFGRTVSLQSVTLPDGTPVSGVTFDSGLTFGPASAAPEPSTLTLLAFGGVSLLGYAGLRRRRKVATS